MLQLENDLEKYGLSWAEHDAEARRMDDLTKTVMSQIMLEWLGEPVNMRETRARADERFIQHLKGVAAARSLANTFRVKYDTCQHRIEIRRSINAVNRAQMGMR